MKAPKVVTISMSQVLEATKKYLYNGYEPLYSNCSLYICYAIEGVRVMDVGVTPNSSLLLQLRKEDLYRYIFKLLEGYGSLGSWLFKYHPHLAQNGTLNRVKLQATRLAWMNWMIADLKSKGL